MKNDYKLIYIILSVMIILFLIFFTVINVFIYGSVMQVNLVILTLLLVFPLYYGFKNKVFIKRMAVLVSGYFILVLISTLLILPEYTFDEARSLVEETENVKGTLHLKRYTTQTDFFYKGDYLIETDGGSFAFDIHNGNYKIIEK